MDNLFLKTWESIILKYNQPFEDSPEIDIVNLSVTNNVDKLETLPSRPFGRSDFSAKKLKDLNESKVFEALSWNSVITLNEQNGMFFEDEEEPSSGETLSSTSGSDLEEVEQDEISNKCDLTNDSSDGSDEDEESASSEDNSLFTLQDSSAVKSVHKQDRHRKPMCRDDSTAEQDKLDCKLSVDSSVSIIPTTLCSSRTQQSSTLGVQNGNYLGGLEPAKSNHYRGDGSCENHRVIGRERQHALDCQPKKRIIPRLVTEYTPAEEEKMYHTGFKLVSKKNNQDNSEHKMATVQHSHRQQLFMDIKHGACLSHSVIPKMRKSLFSSVSSELEVIERNYSDVMAKIKKEDCTSYCNTEHTRYSLRMHSNQCSPAKHASHDCVQEFYHGLQNHNAIVSLLEPVQPGQMKKTFDELKVLSEAHKEKHLHHQKCIRIDDLWEPKHTDLTKPSPQPVTYSESNDLKIQRMKASFRVKQNRGTVNHYRQSKPVVDSSKMPSSPQLISMLQELKMRASDPQPVCKMKERKSSMLDDEGVHLGAEMLSNKHIDDGDSSSFSDVSGSSKTSISLLSDSSSTTDQSECVTATSGHQDDMEMCRKTSTTLDESSAISPQQSSKLECSVKLNEYIHHLSHSHPHLEMSGSLRSVQKQFYNLPYKLNAVKSQECARLLKQDDFKTPEKSRTSAKQYDQRSSYSSTTLKSPSPCECQAPSDSGMLKLSSMDILKNSKMQWKEPHQSSHEQSERKTSENSCSLKYNEMKTISDSTKMLKEELHQSCQQHDSLKASAHPDSLTCSNLRTPESSGRSKRGSYESSDSETLKNSRTLNWSDPRTPENSKILKESYESCHQRSGSKRTKNAKSVKPCNFKATGSLKNLQKQSEPLTFCVFNQLKMKSPKLVLESLEVTKTNLNSVQMSTPKKQDKINMLEISGISVIKSRDGQTCAERDKVRETIKPSSPGASNIAKKQGLKQKTEQLDDFCEAKMSTQKPLSLLLSKSKRRKLLCQHEGDDLEPEPKRLCAKISKMSYQKAETPRNKSDQTSFMEMNASLLCPGPGLCKKAFCFSCLDS